MLGGRRHLTDLGYRRGPTGAGAYWGCSKMKQCKKQVVAVGDVADIVRRAQALVFDFDGTLVDSNPIKWSAFEACFAEFPEHRREILTYCQGRHHIPRWEKFRHVYKQILKLPYSPEIAAALHGRFAAATTRQIIDAPEVPGATRFLLAASSDHITALLSSTPHDTLLHVLEGRGWLDYFQAMQGAPVDKATWLQAFREERKLYEQDVVFFGDTPEDASAALAAGCTFVGVANNVLASGVIHSIADFTELLTP